MKPLRIDAAGDHEDSVWGDSAVGVPLPNMLAGNPDLVNLRGKGAKPDFRKASEFPRLEHDPLSLGRRHQVRRPLVAHMEIRWAVEGCPKPIHEPLPTLVSLQSE